MHTDEMPSPSIPPSRRPDRASIVAASIAGALIVAATSGCGSGGKAQPASVLLVTIDTLRADHCSLYGYERETTPALERLGAEGVVFDVAYAPMGATCPAHASLFASRHPLGHGLLRNGLPLPDEARTLAEVMRDAGYRTAAFVSSFPLTKRFAFDQGFEHYDETFDVERASVTLDKWAGREVETGFDRPARDTTDAALAWLAGQAGDTPLFLWVHYFDPHDPYMPPPEHELRFLREKQRGGRNVVAHYDEEIAYCDEQLGRLVEAFDGRAGEPLIVVTADHGEGLMDHGWMGHNRHTYEEELRVPLVVRWRRELPAGRRVRSPATLIDVAPTVTSLLGIQTGGADWEGAPLLGESDEARAAERSVYLQRPYYPRGRPQHDERGFGFGVRRGRWKLFVAPEEGRAELYDLEVDPRERSNVAEQHPDRTAELERAVGDWSRAQEANALPPPAGGSVSREALEALRALGYAGGSERSE